MRLKLCEDAIRMPLAPMKLLPQTSRLRMKSPILNPQMRPMKRMPMRKTAAQPSLEFPPERGKPDKIQVEGP